MGSSPMAAGWKMKNRRKSWKREMNWKRDSHTIS
jgi:hypothetical protein